MPSKPILAALLLSLTLTPAASALRLELQAIATGLDDVVGIAHAGDDRLFLASREGQIFILRGGQILSRPYLDIRDRVLYTGEPESEQGLLSVVFHPDYTTNGFLYVTYVNPDGDSVIARYTVNGPNPDTASKGSERILLTVPQPGPNHNLNYLAFGPDGYLYVASGDGGYQPEPRCSGQETNHLLGKLLRLDVDQNVDQPPYHGIPFDNPFVGPGDPRDEIWALGLRNPWRFAFDPNGNIFITDVGQSRRDEINFQPASSPGGENYGFKMMEGFFCRGSSANCSMPIPPCNSPLYTPPILDNTLNDRHCALIGGYVYRGSRVPELAGRYLTGDYCGTTTMVYRQGNTWVREELENDLPELVTFGEDVEHELYLVAGGTLSKIVGVGQNPQPEPCVVDDTTLCLNQGRFRVRATWRNFENQTGAGRRVPQGSNDSGMLWFFQQDNWEMLVKVIDACTLDGHFWVFAAATTNVEYTLEVFDSETGALKRYTNPLGKASPAITDTLAFATCP